MSNQAYKNFAPKLQPTPWFWGFKSLYATLISVFLCFNCICLPCLADAPSLIGKEQQQAVLKTLIGNWTEDTGAVKLQLKISDNGKFALNEIEGNYSINGKNIKLYSDQTEITYQFDVMENQLTLSGGDLNQELKLSRVKNSENYLHRLFEFSPKSMKLKLYRILIIAVIVFVGRILVALLRVTLRFVIYCDWGPLGFVYRSHKNRAMTIHSLVLNLFKYIIYFVALGFILTELGINYTAYLASLSVIGLAIGFGSQGLVQDMVTGFFIIFEGQFDVGDMIEIPPYTGTVEELGLRMTKLRNYFGQKVIIPNRNIAAVGNYAKGAQQAQIDVAIANKEVAQEAKDLLKQVVNEISCQFAGIIVSAPNNLSESSLATGEHFVRVYLAIWPQQQWVVEQQMLPRIREAFSRKGIEIPNDRVIAFYHPREETATGGKRKKTNSQEIAPKNNV